ncbi:MULTISPECIES: hypothetical protein [Corynebacterium]|jgi:hypothetical protein|nr:MULTISPECIES: hypothetical protein [Corynebacterium]
MSSDFGSGEGELRDVEEAHVEKAPPPAAEQSYGTASFPVYSIG